MARRNNDHNEEREARIKEIMERAKRLQRETAKIKTKAAKLKTPPKSPKKR